MLIVISAIVHLHMDGLADFLFRPLTFFAFFRHSRLTKCSTMLLTLWCRLLPYGYSYKASSCASPLSRLSCHL